MDMTRTIAVVSGKGGVGKTTVTSNLAYALTNLGENVIVIDANLTAPNLGIHLGVPLSKNTLNDVLKGEVPMEDALYPHPHGFRFMPSRISVNALKNVDPEKLSNVTFNLTGKTDFVLLDCAAGLGREAVCGIQAADEVLIVTNPELPCVIDALMASRVAGEMNKKVLGVVVNRSRKKPPKHAMQMAEIQETLGLPIISQIPEEPEVLESISLRKPVIDYNPKAPASVELSRLAHTLTGREFVYEKPSFLSGLFGRISNLRKQ
jgi:septum site-determining protein MinD